MSHIYKDPSDHDTSSNEVDVSWKTVLDTIVIISGMILLALATTGIIVGVKYYLDKPPTTEGIVVIDDIPKPKIPADDTDNQNKEHGEIKELINNKAEEHKKLLKSELEKIRSEIASIKDEFENLKLQEDIKEFSKDLIDEIDKSRCKVCVQESNN